MTETVVIKTIGDEPILMKETTVSHITWEAVIIELSAIAIFCLCSYFGFFTPEIFKDNFYGSILLSIIFGMSGIFAVFNGLFIHAGKLEKPAYTIYAYPMSYYDRITIEKTTPEADQIAVCKAAQELESKLLVIEKNKHKLELIASKCR